LLRFATKNASLLINYRVTDKTDDDDVLIVVNTGEDESKVDVTPLDTVPSNAVLTYYTGSLEADYSHA
jgi:hypothetical protein